MKFSTHQNILTNLKDHWTESKDIKASNIDTKELNTLISQTISRTAYSINAQKEKARQHQELMYPDLRVATPFHLRAIKPII